MKSNWILKGMAATLALGFVLVTDESYAQGRIGQHLRSQAPATQQTKAPQARFVDADGDGVCDLQGTGQGRYGREGRRGQGMGQGMRGQGNCQGAGFVDADGNGVCDHINSATGMGRNFVDENGDGINDRSPLAQLQLTPEQIAAIQDLRAAGKGPHRDALESILTEEQKAQLAEIRVARQAENQANRPGAGMKNRRGGHGGQGMGPGQGEGNRGRGGWRMGQ